MGQLSLKLDASQADLGPSDYDDVTRNQLIDYVYGESKDDVGFLRVLDWIPETSRDFLFLGCGIGKHAAEARRRFPRAVVTATDSSESVVGIATRLFGDDDIRFVAADLNGSEWLQLGSFDIVVVQDLRRLLDSSPTHGFGGLVEKGLRADGFAILEYGEPEFGSGGSASDSIEVGVQRLADQFGGQREALPPSLDREFAVIRKANRPASATPGSAAKPPLLEARKDRAARVKARLGIRITKDGYLIPDGAGPDVLVVSPIRNGYSETFIKAQIEGIPARVHVLFGYPPSEEDDEGRPLVPKWALRLGTALSWLIGARAIGRIRAFWLERFMHSRNIRAVLAEYGPTGVRMIDACQRRAIPLVTHFYGFDASEKAVIREFRDGYRHLLAEESATIVVSRDMENRVYDLGATQGTVHRIPCGVDVRRFASSDPANSPPIFVAVGRFVDKKAPHLTISAFSQARNEVEDVQLWMVGDGPLLGACESMVKALGLSDCVHFLGPRPHEELSRLLGSARAFVQHSMTAPSGDSEGLPVAIVEAGACGIPVISTRHAGIPDVVIDGETGYLVDEGDVAGMAERMVMLARDPGLAGRLGAQARARISEQFKLSDSLDRLWAVLDAGIQHG